MHIILNQGCPNLFYNRSLNQFIFCSQIQFYTEVLILTLLTVKADVKRENLKEVLALTLYVNRFTDAVTIHTSKWGEIVVRRFIDALGVRFPLHTQVTDDVLEKWRRDQNQESKHKTHKVLVSV